MKRYFIFAGELSGDLHGGHLLAALKRREPLSHFSGVGGPAMRKEGLETLFPMEDFQVMGFSQVLKKLPFLVKRFYSVRKHVLTTRPDAVILIDYPGFNLRLAKSLRSKGYQGKIIQYIAPTVWAHGKHRIKEMATHYNLLLTILPFESAYFSDSILKTEYVGHPLLEITNTHLYNKEWFKKIGLLSSDHIIALFPGSRSNEISLHLPLQLEAASILKKKFPFLQFVISAAHSHFYQNIRTLTEKKSFILGKDIFISAPEDRYNLMKSSQCAIAKSGTTSLELALHLLPSVIHYQVTPLNYYIAKYFLKLKLPYYCLVNLLGNKEIFPEFIEKQASSLELAKAAEILLSKTEKREEITKECKEIAQTLGYYKASERAAESILGEVYD